MKKQTSLPFVAPKPSTRPVGRRCPGRHRAAWVLSGGWLWCPECGSLCPEEVPARRHLIVELWLLVRPGPQLYRVRHG